MRSDSEESWHSIQEPETLEEVFRKRVIEFDPQLGLSVSKSVRRRSLELVDTLVLPLSGVDKDGRISLGSFPRLRTIRRLVVVYSCPVEGLGRIFDEIRSHTDVDLSRVSELEIIRDGLAGGLGLDAEGEERMVAVVVGRVRGQLRRVRLCGLEFSAVGFLRLLQSDELRGLERLELEDCEFEGVRRMRGLESGQGVSMGSLRELFCIRTDPAFARFCPNLKSVTYEAKLPMEDDAYESFRRPSGGLGREGGIEFFELRVPSSGGEVPDSYFLEGFFAGSFPELESLRELRIVGSSEAHMQSKQRRRHGVQRQLGSVFPRLRVLELRNLYIPLDTFDHLILMFPLTRGLSSGCGARDEEAEGFSRAGQKVSASYDLRFEDGTSRNRDYNISKYQGMSIEEESDFMLSSDYINSGLGFSAPDDIVCGRGGSGRDRSMCVGFGGRGACGGGEGGFGFGSGSDYGDWDEGCFGGRGGRVVAEKGPAAGSSTRGRPFSAGQRDSPRVMQPFLEIRSWRVRQLLEPREAAARAESDGDLHSFDSGVFVLDRQLREMRHQSLTEIHRNLVSRTVLEHLVDPLATRVSVSDSRVVLSLGFDNLVYSGYMLGVLFGCQRTIRELSALSFLIPISFFCQLELDRIRTLEVSLFKDRNLEPEDLIGLCDWVERHGRSLAYIHVRVTGTSSKWVPKETEITRLVSVWRKLCPRAAGGDGVRFECCFTDHIFSKMDSSLSRDFGELDTDSD